MKKLILSTMTSAILLANDTELETLKTQLSQMQQMLSAMQAKISALENTHSGTEEARHDLPVAHHAEHSDHEEASPLSLAMFVDGSYVNRSQKDEQLQHLALPGIAHSPYGEDGHGHGTYNAQNGFNLNYVELLLLGKITEDLDVKTLLHFSEGGAEIEEAYFTAKNLPFNLTAKGGKFLSSFGYLNRQHHHQWDFSDMPLVYETFLGSEGLNEIGAQLQWNVPIEPRVTLGIEALQGKNEAMFGHTSLQDPYSGNALASSAAQPSLLVAYAKASADIADTQIRAGASMAHGTTRLDHFAEEDAFAMRGKSDLYGIDLAIRQNFTEEKSLTWQSEWLSRIMDGTGYTGNGATLSDAPLEKKQSGYYTQLVYAHDEQWRAGVRYDSIYQNRVLEGGVNLSLPESMNQFSAMLEYNTDEIARYRLQYIRSNAYFDESLIRQNFDTLLFSVNFTLGRHSHLPF